MKRFTTYIDEENIIDLFNYYNNHFNDQFDEKWYNTENAIQTILQEYMDTGGDVAGGYVKATPNIVMFIEDYFSKLEKLWKTQTELGLWKGNLFEFILHTYVQFNWRVKDNEPLDGAKYWDDEISDYVIVKNN